MGIPRITLANYPRGIHGATWVRAVRSYQPGRQWGGQFLRPNPLHSGGDDTFWCPEFPAMLPRTNASDCEERGTTIQMFE